MSIRESLDNRSPLIGRNNFPYLFTGGRLRFRPGRWNLDAVDRVRFDEFRRIRGIGQTAGKKTFQVYQGIPAVSDGDLFIGLTGVQNVRYLADVVEQLRPKRILECVDMDVRTNPQVQRAQAKIRSICMPLCEDYRAFTWPAEQKGIDDWLLFESLKQEHLYRAA